MTKQRFLNWVLPGIVFSVAFGFAACSDAMKGNPKDCATSGGGHSGSGTTSTGSSHFDAGPTIEQPPGGTFTSSNDPDNTFDHFNDPGSDGSKDPFEILKERAEEGPPEVRTRLHSCTKISYAALGAFLTSRGVNLAAKSSGSGPKTAGELYSQGGDALGVAKFDAREGESYFHTTASATKLFDIFVQAAPEIIANIQNQDDCKVSGVGHPMFDPVTGKCTYEALSCIMGRPATLDDLTVCNLMIEQADPTNPADLKTKQNITVATFLSAANTCE